ncbi:ABC-2 family transporter protein [Rubripirellula tenax]|uniref:ABC-2 family transporter protein n=1 Tax=Rubripirellula tenax TaxID=2528015 RepID=A0A5C6FE60_9BACT|nr:ABC transporter permease [Rubripirellula tenax]TWU60096.1 ABC-2 family transporter protein [Rubripirellula tenax]
MTTLATEIPVPPTPSRLDRLDAWCERIGDSLNPILVKETRQALKSRQFVGTFSVLLVAALAWTIIGSLSMMPQIYTSPSAPRMLIGYYLVLALPMLVVVPLAAYRSLEGEIDDGTLELLSITVLSPWQIVLGKLASAMLQMLLYFVALFPCVAYAYTLRGVDLPTTLLIMGILLVAGIVLTIVALFFAPLARTRTGRITTLLAVMMLLLGAEWGLAYMVISMILEGNPMSANGMLFAVIATLLVAFAIGHLLLTATAAQLTPESENRSTHLRVSLLFLTTVVLGVAVLGIRMLEEVGIGLSFMLALFLAGLWTVTGSMMVAESSTITPRIRRELPSSLLARMFLTWLTPGPVSGLVFSVVTIFIVNIAIALVIQLAAEQAVFNSFAPRSAISMLSRLCVAYSAYLVGFLTIVRWVVAAVRIRNHPRVEVGLAAMIAVAMLAALVPYSIGLHYNDYRSYAYSPWQITNWVWTLGQILDRSNTNYIVETILVFVTIGFFATVMASPGIVMPRRTAMPERVKQELEKPSTSPS